MPMKVVLSLLLGCLLALTCWGCPTSYEFDYSTCTFFMTYSNDSCTDFAFN